MAVRGLNREDHPELTDEEYYLFLLDFFKDVLPTPDSIDIMDTPNAIGEYIEALPDLSNEFLTEPDTLSAFMFDQDNIESIEDLKKLGVYKNDNAYFKDFDIEHDGKLYRVTYRMNITAHDDVLRVYTRGIDCQVGYDFAFRAGAAAMGVFLPEEITKAYEWAFQKYIQLNYDAKFDSTQEWINLIVDANGRSMYDKTFMDVVYNFLCDEVGPFDKHYEYTPITRNEGMQYLISYSNKSVPAQLCYYFQEDGNPYENYYTLEEMEDYFNQAYDFSEAAKEIYNMPLNLIVVWNPAYPGDVNFDIVGYNINGPLVVTNDGTGQHISVNVTECSWIQYRVNTDHELYIANSSNGKFTFDSQSLVYNYPKSDFFWHNPLDHNHATYRSGTLYCSLGGTAQSKGYEVTGTTPVKDVPIEETYTNWIVFDPIVGYPVTFPVGEVEKDPETVRKGTKPPKIKPPKNIPGVPPVIPKDNISKSTTPDPDPVQGVFGLFTVWDMTKAGAGSPQGLVSLGQFLWNQTNLERILEIFKNDPMQAVISCHQIYISPTSNSTGTVKMGYVDTEVAAWKVDDRYQELECGTLKVDFYFNDYRDYQTNVSIYLPFIGIKELDVNDVMGASINIRYVVDVWTGDCIAFLRIIRDSGTPGGPNAQNSKVLYIFEGNCASNIPLTAADKTRLYQKIIGGVTNVVSGVVSGASKGPAGALVGGLGAAVGALSPEHTINIERSGNISGNHGAMGFKKPYLIIKRVIPADTTNYEQFKGNPAYWFTKVGNVSGYNQFYDVRLDNFDTATDYEKTMILNQLKSGVII